MKKILLGILLGVTITGGVVWAGLSSYEEYVEYIVFRLAESERIVILVNPLTLDYTLDTSSGANSAKVLDYTLPEGKDMPRAQINVKGRVY